MIRNLIAMKYRVKAIFCALHGNKLLKFPLDSWNAVRFILKYSILRELSVITLPIFSVFGNQIVRFFRQSAHPTPAVVSKEDEKREKSQFKMDQDFGRNRKTAEKGVIVLAGTFQN